MDDILPLPATSRGRADAARLDFIEVTLSVI
jgi:hypothetical protein